LSGLQKPAPFVEGNNPSRISRRRTLMNLEAIKPLAKTSELTKEHSDSWKKIQEVQKMPGKLTQEERAIRARELSEAFAVPAEKLLSADTAGEMEYLAVALSRYREGDTGPSDGLSAAALQSKDFVLNGGVWKPTLAEVESMSMEQYARLRKTDWHGDLAPAPVEEPAAEEESETPSNQTKPEAPAEKGSESEQAPPGLIRVPSADELDPRSSYGKDNKSSVGMMEYAESVKDRYK
jgi:hypothetical protein